MVSDIGEEEEIHEVQSEIQSAAGSEIVPKPDWFIMPGNKTFHTHVSRVVPLWLSPWLYIESIFDNL